METFTRDRIEAPAPLEVVELDLALRHQDLLALGFEGAVLRALDQVGGAMLFRMRMNGLEGCDWIAAVAIDGAGERRVALVAQRAEGGPLIVEDAETSQLPVARIAMAYANVIQRLEQAS